MPKAPEQSKRPERRMKGFEPAFGLMRDPLRKGAEARGFAETRILTGWEEIAGPTLAAITRPLKMSWGREGMGATLTVLVSPAHGPAVQMELPRLTERVNAAFGYRAIARITLTQTAATGFAEGQTPFAAAAKPAPRDPEALAEAGRKASEMAAPVQDEGLRSALEAFAQSILSKARKQES